MSHTQIKHTHTHTQDVSPTKPPISGFEEMHSCPLVTTPNHFAWKAEGAAWKAAEPGAWRRGGGGVFLRRASVPFLSQDGCEGKRDETRDSATRTLLQCFEWQWNSGIDYNKHTQSYYVLWHIQGRGLTSSYIHLRSFKPCRSFVGQVGASTLGKGATFHLFLRILFWGGLQMKHHS